MITIKPAFSATFPVSTSPKKTIKPTAFPATTRPVLATTTFLTTKTIKPTAFPATTRPVLATTTFSTTKTIKPTAFPATTRPVLATTTGPKNTIRSAFSATFPSTTTTLPLPIKLRLLNPHFRRLFRQPQRLFRYQLRLLNPHFRRLFRTSRLHHMFKMKLIGKPLTRVTTVL